MSISNEALQKVREQSSGLGLSSMTHRILTRSLAGPRDREPGHPGTAADFGREVTSGGQAA